MIRKLSANMLNFKTHATLAIVSSALILEITGLARLARNPGYGLHKRGFPAPPMGNLTSTDNTTSPINMPITNQPPPNSSGADSSQQVPFNSSDPCAVYPLDQSTWNQFHWDDYIHSFPGGMNLSVQVKSAECYQQYSI